MTQMTIAERLCGIKIGYNLNLEWIQDLIECTIIDSANTMYIEYVPRLFDYLLYQI